MGEYKDCEPMNTKSIPMFREVTPAGIIHDTFTGEIRYNENDEPKSET